jgi:hypothetical protein
VVVEVEMDQVADGVIQEALVEVEQLEVMLDTVVVVTQVITHQ